MKKALKIVVALSLALVLALGLVALTPPVQASTGPALVDHVVLNVPAGVTRSAYQPLRFMSWNDATTEHHAVFERSWLRPGSELLIEFTGDTPSILLFSHDGVNAPAQNGWNIFVAPDRVANGVAAFGYDSILAAWGAQTFVHLDELSVLTRVWGNAPGSVTVRRVTFRTPAVDVPNNTPPPPGPSPTPDARRVTISGTNFYVNFGQEEIFFVGGNTPWNNFNDFGSQWGNRFEYEWWDDHFRQLNEMGVNSTRVWITCDAWGGAVILNRDGTFNSITPSFFDDVDALFRIAERHEIYIMATMMSFDHVRQNADPHRSYLNWRAMLRCTDAINSVINGYIIPFVDRYKHNPFLWSIDLCNEPDWMYEEDGVPWENIMEFMARSAAAIRQRSDVPVTVGMASVKYHGPANGDRVGNMLDDAFMISLADGNPYAVVDFYSPHHYAWMTPWFNRPFEMTPEDFFGMPIRRPVLIGEAPALSETGSTLALDYYNLLQNGWTGLLAWSTNGVDTSGGFNEVQEGVLGFFAMINNSTPIWAGSRATSLDMWANHLSERNADEAGLGFAEFDRHALNAGGSIRIEHTGAAPNLIVRYWGYTSQPIPPSSISNGVAVYTYADIVAVMRSASVNASWANWTDVFALHLVSSAAGTVTRIDFLQ